MEMLIYGVGLKEMNMFTGKYNINHAPCSSFGLVFNLTNRLAFFYGPLFVTIFVAILLIISTVQYVISAERKTRNFSVKSMNLQRQSSTRSVSSYSNLNLQSQASIRSVSSYSNRVATQSFCYLAAYFITWTPLASVRIIQFSGGTVPQWL